MCHPITWKVNFRPAWSSLPARRGQMAACTARDGGTVPPSLHPAALGSAGALAPRIQGAAGYLRGRAATARGTASQDRPGNLNSSFRAETKSLSLIHGSAADWARRHLSRGAALPWMWWSARLGVSTSRPEAFCL